MKDENIAALLKELQKNNVDELAKLMKCNDSIAQLNYQRYQT